MDIRNENDSSREKALEIARKAAEALDSKKGLEIKILGLSKETIIADYFVIATGTSSTHIGALADEVEFKLNEQLEIKPHHTEGLGGGTWILMDYSSVVVHIFTKEARDFYNLERLWSDSEAIDFNQS